MNKRLNKLSNENFIYDIKQFIRNNHNFYDKKNPEMKTLANRLHEEYILKNFYNIFNKLWKSGYHNERFLAVSALELYKKDYDKETWRFLIPKLNEIKDFDEAEKIGVIIGEMIIKYPVLKREIYKIANKRNVYYRKIALSSCLPLIKIKDWNFIFGIIQNRINDREDNIKEFNGLLLNEIAKKNKTILRRFILRNMNMSNITFNIISDNFKDLKKKRKIKAVDNNGLSWLKIIGN